MGQKRANPGDTEPKDASSAPTVIAPEIATKLEGLEKEHARAELKLELETRRKLVPVFEKRRPVLKTIPNFWYQALQNDPLFLSMIASSSEDLEALSHLEDVWVVRDDVDPRLFTLEFHFGSNPFFTEAVLKKEYKLKTPFTGELTDGLYAAQLEFTSDFVTGSGTPIQWKDASKNLTQLYPKKQKAENDDEDEDMIDLDDGGSFFNLFEGSSENDYMFGSHIADDFFQNAISYYKNEIDEEDEDEDISSESGDSDAEDIDLERPKKRVKRS